MNDLRQMNTNDLTASEILAKLAAAEAALLTVVTWGAPRHELLTMADETTLCLAAFDCRRIRVDIMRYLDERNRNQEDE